MCDRPNLFVCSHIQNAPFHLSLPKKIAPMNKGTRARSRNIYKKKNAATILGPRVKIRNVVV